MTARLKVLIVGDSDADADRIVRTLRAAGYSPQCARVATAAALTDAASTGDWDVITCDDVMSGFDGLEAVIIARSVAPDTPVIAMADEPNERRSALLVRLGACAFVSKNRLATLARAIALALDAE